jgi:Ca-activated chloride channel homolog
MRRHVPRVSQVLLLLFWIFVAGSLLLEAQGPQNQQTVEEISRIKVDVSLVTMDITVIPPTSGEFRAEDFIIYDNGVVQHVTHFSRDLIPLSVALVADRSTSIEAFLPVLKKATLSALGRLKPEDQVALFRFDDETLKLKEFTVDHNLIAKIVGSFKLGGVGGGTDIYGVLYRTARYLKMKSLQNRRAIILISDNCHTLSNRIDKEDAYAEILESGATLFSIQTPGKNPSGCHGSIPFVKRLAEETGGELLDVNASTSLQEALEKAISNLRLQYTLGFSPSDPGKEGSYHKLTVRLASEDRCPACRLLARKGYYSGISASISNPRTSRLIAGNPLKQSSPERLQRLRFCMNTAIHTDFDLPDIPIVVRTFEQKGLDGKPQLKLDLHIDFSNIGFVTVGGHHRFRLHIGIFSPGQGIRNQEEKYLVLEGMLEEENYNQVRANGKELSITIPRMAQEEILKIVAYDEEADTVGSRTVTVFKP